MYGSLAAALEEFHTLHKGRSQRLALSNPETAASPSLFGLDQDGNQRTSHWFNRRWLLQDTPRLQPMRAAVLDTGAECNILTSFDVGRLSFDRYPNIHLHTFDDLRCHENFRWKEHTKHYYACGLICPCSAAIPASDARPSRRRRLNAPQLREDNSQCSDPSEEETQ